MSEIPEKQIKRLRSLLSEAETNLSAAKELLVSILGDGETISAPRETVVSSPEGKIIEGIFDGQIMIGPDGKNYPVPANYASKSKLVEGDAGKEYQILYASVTYFHLREGSQVSVVIPATNSEATWAAVEAAL